MQDVESFLLETSQKIDSVLDLVVPAESDEPSRLHEAIRWSLFGGGKRLRPALVLAGGIAFSVDETKLYRTAAAVEMIHTYSLIHDDLPAMDDDDLRRGRETCHKKFGEATAILAGDVLQTMAFKLIAQDEKLDAKMRLTIIDELADASGTPDGMAAGQQFDLEAEGKSMTLEGINAIHSRKTGSLISFSARVGAVVAGANDGAMAAVSTYGRHLGMLFQITDDLLDITESTETLGKTAGKDAAAQKATFPALLGLDTTRRLAQQAMDEASAALRGFDDSARTLQQLAGYVLHRTS